LGIIGDTDKNKIKNIHKNPCSLKGRVKEYKLK